MAMAYVTNICNLIVVYQNKQGNIGWHGQVFIKYLTKSWLSSVLLVLV